MEKEWTISLKKKKKEWVANSWSYTFGLQFHWFNWIIIIIYVCVVKNRTIFVKGVKKYSVFVCIFHHFQIHIFWPWIARSLIRVNQCHPGPYVAWPLACVMPVYSWPTEPNSKLHFAVLCGCDWSPNEGSLSAAMLGRWNGKL